MLNKHSYYHCKDIIIIQILFFFFLDNLPLELKTLDASNITVKSNEAIPRKTSSSGVCRLEKPVSVDLSYNINWQMKLAGNDFKDNVTNRKYGFFRFGFESAVPQSLNQLSLYPGKKYTVELQWLEHLCDHEN